METDNPFVLLKALKGAPLSVLIALRLFLRPASETDLARATDYNRETVAIALGRLEQFGLVDRAHMRGWQLTAPAYQLPLFVPNELEGREEPEAVAAPEVLRMLPSGVERHGDAAPSVGKSGSQDAAGDGAAATVGISDSQPDEAEPPSVGISSAHDPAAPLAAASVRSSGSQAGDAEPPSVGISSTHDEALPPVPPSVGISGSRSRQVRFLTVGKSSTQLRLHLSAPLTVGKSSTHEANLTHTHARTRGRGGLINLPPGDITQRPPLHAPARATASVGISGTQAVEPPFGTPSVGNSNTGAAQVQPSNLTLDPDERTLVEDLVALAGCTRRRAETAVRAARVHGQPTAYLQLQVLYWHNYIASRRGETLRNPGYFVAAKLEAGEPCPLRNVSPEHSERAWALRGRLEDRHEDDEEEDVGADLAEPGGPEPTEPAVPERTDAERCADIRQHLALSLPEAAFEAWLKDSAFALHDRTLLVYAANPQAQVELDERFRPAIRRVAALALGLSPHDLQVQVLPQPELVQEALHA